MLDIAARCCQPLSIFVTAVVEVAMFNPVLSFFSSTLDQDLQN